MNREVFLSLLALDAYNRGYGQKPPRARPTGGRANAHLPGQTLVLACEFSRANPARHSS